METDAMKNRGPLISLPWILLAFLCLAHAPTRAQEENAAKKEKKQAEAADRAWKAPPDYPRLSALHKEQAKERLVAFKNRNPKKRDEAVHKMVSIGRSVIPFLLSRIDTRHADQGECIYRSLRALMDRRDAFVLKKCARSKCDRERLLAAAELAEMKDPHARDTLKALLADPKEEVRLEAALGLAEIEDPAGMGEIIRAVARDYKHVPERVTRVIPRLKGHVYGSLFFPFLSDKEKPEVRIAAVEVIVRIGDKGLKSVLGRALDDPHNLVKAAAVNGLRRLVKQQEPRAYSNVFELVEAVNEWKK